MKKKLIAVRKVWAMGPQMKAKNEAKHHDAIKYINKTVRQEQAFNIVFAWYFETKEERQKWRIIYLDLLIISMK